MEVSEADRDEVKQDIQILRASEWSARLGESQLSRDSDPSRREGRRRPQLRCEEHSILMREGCHETFTRKQLTRYE